MLRLTFQPCVGPTFALSRGALDHASADGSSLPVQYVRPYVRRNKTDRTDTEAMLEAARW